MILGTRFVKPENLSQKVYFLGTVPHHFCCRLWHESGTLAVAAQLDTGLAYLDVCKIFCRLCTDKVGTADCMVLVVSVNKCLLTHS